MNDQWIPGPPVKPPTWIVNPLPPSNDWNDTVGCSAPSGPAIVDSITITGVPATISSLYWQVSLNDGSSPPNFQINALDGKGNLVDTPLGISGVTGEVTLLKDPTLPLGVATKHYADSVPPGEAPMDYQTYARDMGQWIPLPPIIPDAPGISQIMGRMNSTWAVVPIQVDAPSDGNTYGRFNGAWNAALPLTGGTITGSLTVNQVMTVQGSNSFVLNGPLGAQRSIFSTAVNVARWLMAIGDATPEGLNNTGANFTLSAYGTTGAWLGNWLTIARADGNTIFNGSGVTVQGSLAVNGYLMLPGAGNLAIYGGTDGQVLTTNGQGVLSWQTPPGASGGIPDAPNDGELYGRQSEAWVVVPEFPDAPNDGQLYGRESEAWAVVPPGLSDAPSDSRNYARFNGMWSSVVSFPEAPPDGQYYARRSLGWAALPPPAPPVTVSDTAPANPVSGQLWWDSVGGQLYVWYVDANSSQWVTASNAGSPYVLPPASTTVLGGVKVDGTSIKAATDGTIAVAVAPIGDNRVINGDMWVDQRNGGASGTATGVYTVDRWIYSAVSATLGTWGQSVNNAAGQAASGFGYYLSFLSASAHTPAPSDYCQFVHIIEADFVADFAWGAASAKPVTLSFWAVASLTGTFSGSVRNYAGTRSYPFTYSIPTANVWAKIAVTIPGDTAGSWVLQGNGGGVVVGFDLGTGSTGRAPAGAWAAGGFLGANGAVSIVAVNGASFGLTGVKLEIGSVATPFNMQSLTKRFADCQRYHQTLYAIILDGYNNAGGGCYGSFIFPVPMRAAPSVVYNSPSYVNASNLQTNIVTSQLLMAVMNITATGAGYATANAIFDAEL